MWQSHTVYRHDDSCPHSHTPLLAVPIVYVLLFSRVDWAFNLHYFYVFLFCYWVYKVSTDSFTYIYIYIYIYIHYMYITIEWLQNPPSPSIDTFVTPSSGLCTCCSFAHCTYSLSTLSWKCWEGYSRPSFEPYSKFCFKCTCLSFDPYGEF